MTAQAEFVGQAFDQVFESFKKATESTLQMQHDLFRQWTALWPGFPKTPPSWAEQAQKFHKDWSQAMTELVQKYQQAWDRQYKAGMQTLEEAFRLAEAKDPEELRKKTVELWQKSFDCLKELAQAQVRDFQTAIEKWMELAKKANP
jgi:hypothetical protein